MINLRILSPTNFSSTSFRANNEAENTSKNDQPKTSRGNRRSHEIMPGPYSAKEAVKDNQARIFDKFTDDQSKRQASPKQKHNSMKY